MATVILKAMSYTTPSPKKIRLVLVNDAMHFHSIFEHLNKIAELTHPEEDTSIIRLRSDHGCIGP